MTSIFRTWLSEQPGNPTLLVIVFFFSRATAWRATATHPQARHQERQLILFVVPSAPADGDEHKSDFAVVTDDYAAPIVVDKFLGPISASNSISASPTKVERCFERELMEQDTVFRVGRVVSVRRPAGSCNRRQAQEQLPPAFPGRHRPKRRCQRLPQNCQSSPS